MTDFDSVNRLLYESLNELRGKLIEKDYINAKVNIDVGEPGLALETICSQLYEYNIHIPKRIYDLLARAGQMMNMSEDLWKMLLPIVDRT